MNEENNQQQMTTTHYVIMAVCIILALTIFRYFHRNQTPTSDFEWTERTVEIQGKTYKALTPKNQNIDDETLHELWNDPETLEYMEEVKKESTQ